ncbi:Glyoxylase, beta-lactamase superfamily II [Alteribacillus persepolensis]|uniref:Glyoxylase, beta-lactamase superfamily II n=1 Tax=Alteribacillus persepolensis TaxID=568899 RepID=A0A1G7ZAQ4_9BACI|nr:MBL fold metallo-hydrolase [Alteribacillus persepolensis]SDH05695.1 Glyoxylase, beta-lactamase superfamily II [Alteribacillus persepolensis]
MNWKKPEYLMNDIWISDGFDFHLPNRTGTYIINEEELTLIDTGPSISIPALKQSMAHLGRSLADVSYIIVTHVHLDHAGGAGLLLQDCPNAKVVVHPRGARHLADPQRLVQGARAVYNDTFDSLFDPVIPVPKEKILIKDDNEQITFTSGRVLQFFDTPGHAAHHFSIMDSLSKGIFTGDTIGIQYVHHKDMYLPSTSPNQFHPEQMKDSLRLILSKQPTCIFFGHYGVSFDIDEVERQLLFWLPKFVEWGKSVKHSGGGSDALAEQIIKHVTDHYSLHNLADNDPLTTFIKADASISAMGVLDYLSK